MSWAQKKDSNTKRKATVQYGPDIRLVNFPLQYTHLLHVCCNDDEIENTNLFISNFVSHARIWDAT